MWPAEWLEWWTAKAATRGKCPEAGRDDAPRTHATLLGLRPSGSLVAATVEHPGDQHFAFVSIVDNVVLDRGGTDAYTERRSDAPLARVFSQQLESADDVVDESIRGGQAGLLGDVGPDLGEVPFGQRREPIRHVRVSSLERHDHVT